MVAVNHIQLVQNHSNGCSMDRRIGISIARAVGLASIRCTKLKLDYRWKLIGPFRPNQRTNATRQIMAAASSKPNNPKIFQRIVNTSSHLQGQHTAILIISVYSYMIT